MNNNSTNLNKNMKMLVNASITYFILAMTGGVFYREFTKYMGYTGKTTLSILHVHFFVLGAMLLLILAVTDKASSHKLTASGLFGKFFILHNIALPFMTIMFTVRGVAQVLMLDLTKAQSAMISGFAGISHILMTISLGMMFVMVKRALVD